MEEDKGPKRRDSVAIIQIDEEELEDFISESTVTALVQDIENQPTKPDQPNEVFSHRVAGDYNYATKEFMLVGDTQLEEEKDYQILKPSQQVRQVINMSKKLQPKVEVVNAEAENTEKSDPKNPNKNSPIKSEPTKEIVKVKNPGHMRLLEEIKKNCLRLESLDGEVFVSYSEAELCGDTRIQKGHILLTSYRIAFFANQRKKIDIPLGFIERVAMKQDKKNCILIELILKYSPIWKFNFESTSAGLMVDNMLNLYIFPTDITEYFAFSYAKNKEKRSDYRFRYNFFTEYGRLGFLNNSKFKTIENMNSRYCDSYPSIIIVPYQATDHLIKSVAKCRQRERFPVATYLFKNQDTGLTSCLWRSSQIRASSQKWLLDIQYVQYLSYDRLILIDARTKQNAKNMEAPQLYKQVDIEFANLQPVQNIKTSYLKMIEACLTINNTKFIRNVVDSKWYDQIRMLLKTAQRISCLLTSSRNVLVKCSDGWDRTSQLCALAMIIIDPYYRTIEGFEVLVQKEFCSFGQPFHLRLGLKGRGEEQIPVFVQFLDCVSQIMYQYPLSFEFSYKYLSLLAHSLYTNKYGNFLVSCERQFIEYGIKQRTVSVWQEIAENPLSINPFYSNETETGIRVLSVVSSLKANRFWREHFYYLTTGLKDTYKTHPYAEENQDYIYLRHMKMKTQSQMLRKNVSEQMRKIKQLTQELTELKAIPEKPKELEIVYDE